MNKRETPEKITRLVKYYVNIFREISRRNIGREWGGHKSWESKLHYKPEWSEMIRFVCFSES